MKWWALLFLLLLSLTVMAESIGWGELRREDNADTRRFNSLRQHLPSRMQGKGWTAFPVHVGGNFISQTWLRGSGKVLNSNFMEGPGNGWYRLEALHYKLPDAFGVLFTAGENPCGDVSGDGCGVRFCYLSGGRGIVGESADLSFSLWKSGKMVSEVPILRCSVRVPDPFDIAPNWLPGKSLELVDRLTSPEELRQVALHRYAEILPAFDEALQSGKVSRKVYGPYKGGGIPPVCIHQRVTAQEGALIREQVAQQVGEWRRLLEENYRTFYEVYAKVVPWSPR